MNILRPMTNTDTSDAPRNRVVDLLLDIASDHNWGYDERSDENRVWVKQGSPMPKDVARQILREANIPTPGDAP